MKLHGRYLAAATLVIAGAVHFSKAQEAVSNGRTNLIEINHESMLRPQSAEQLGKRLGYSDAARALREAQVFADRLYAGFLPSDWDERCKRDYLPALCSIIDDFFKQATLRSSNASSQSRRKIPNFEPKKVAQLQSIDFQPLLTRAPDWSMKQLERFRSEALKTTSCPRNFSFVLARKAENHLPSPAAYELMDQLDAHGLGCLESDHSHAEYLAMRVALFKIARQNSKEAAPLLARALNAKVKREEYRVLYWADRVAADLGDEAAAKEYRSRLTKKFPSSWYTISAKLFHKEDPMEFFKSQKRYADKYDFPDERSEQRVTWLQLMMLLQEVDYPIKRYGEFIFKDLPPSTPAASMQHLARLFNMSGFYRLQIMALSWIMSNKPEELSFDTIELLHPAPFLSEIRSHSEGFDSAILMGLARQESGFDITATSRANARGLLQILPSTAKLVHRKSKKNQLYDYAHNISVGATYLKKLVERNEGSVEMALASYNAGPAHVKRWSARFGNVSDVQLFVDLIPFRETRDYVPSILRNAYWYHRLKPELNAGAQIPNVSSELLRRNLASTKSLQAKNP